MTAEAARGRPRPAEAPPNSHPAGVRLDRSPMRVKVLFFAAAREKAGTSMCDVELEDGCGTVELREEVGRRFPEAAEMAKSITLAVNKEYTTDVAALKDGDEVAFIPPISGG